MKVISISTDRKILEENSGARQRILDYGKIFEELHIVIFSKKKKDFKLAENIFVYTTNSKNRFFYISDALRVAKGLAKSLKGEVVITAQDPYETGLVGLLLKWSSRLPLQIQVHTDFANRYFILHSFLNMVRFAIAELTLSFADSVRVVSERIKKSVHNLPEHITVLPIFVEKKENNFLKKEKSDKVIFLTVARLEKEKDLGTALRAFKKVSDSHPNTQFVIVGEGSEKKNLQDLAGNLQISDQVIFTDWQDPSKYYREADVYISTSLYEGYGMSLVEAASAGLPLVITDTGIAREVLFDGQEAFICKQKDIKSFADAMRKLASDEGLRKKMGEAAKLAAGKSIISHEEYLVRYRDSMQLAVDSQKEGGGVFKKNILLRYLVAGLLGATTNIGLLFILTHYGGIFYIYSSVLAFLISIAVSFTLQKFWTFSDKELAGMHSQFGRYMAMALLGLIINAVLMYILVDGIHLWYILAQIITNAFIAVFNFLMYKFFIFHKK